jgi:hypothetical protein
VRWAAPTVYEILTSPAAVGTYVPYRWTRRADKPAGEPVENYYPAAVNADTYHAVRATLARRNAVGRGRKGKQGKHVNLLAGLLRDARDGGTISYNHRQGTCRLVPVNGMHSGKATWAGLPAAGFEFHLLDELAEVTSADVEGGGTDAERKVEALSGEVAAADQKMKWYEAKCDGAKDKDNFDRWTAKVAEWGRRHKALAAELAEAQRTAASPVSEAWGEFKSLADLLADDPSDELRLKARAALRRAVEGIHLLVVPVGRAKEVAVRVQFAGQAAHRDYLMTYTPGRSNGKVKRPGVWSVKSFVDVGPPGKKLDLRKEDDAARLEKRLLAAAGQT